MRPFVPARLEAVAFGFLLTAMMTFIVSGTSLFVSLGPGPGFGAAWVKAWFLSWCIAFPAVLVIAPLVRRILARIVIRG